MTVTSALRYNRKWRLRLAIFAALIFPLYALPCFLRIALAGWAGWVAVVAVSDLAGSLVVGFLTNNYRLGFALYIASTAVELLLLQAGGHTTVTLFFGDLVPALVAIYFAQQLYINMGD